MYMVCLPEIKTADSAHTGIGEIVC